MSVFSILSEPSLATSTTTTATNNYNQHSVTNNDSDTTIFQYNSRR